MAHHTLAGGLIVRQLHAEPEICNLRAGIVRALLEAAAHLSLGASDHARARWRKREPPGQQP
jgi:hypothetical protein